MIDGPNKQWIETYRNAPCSMFQLEATEASDYPDRCDMLVGFTVIPDLWQRAHSGLPTTTADLATNGELFWYIKIDGIGGMGDSAFDDREDIEEALDEALSNADIGCVVGAGTGLRYSYVDLVVADAVKGHQVVREVLRGGRITNRTWILPFDADASTRWIGVWDDTPPPPTFSSY